MSSAATRAIYACQASGTGPAGGGAAMPMFDADTNGTGDFVSGLSALKAVGARALLKFVGASSTHMDADSAFSLGLWKSQMDKAFAKASAQQIGNFVADGTLAANYMLDDLKEGTNVFSGGAPTFAEIEACAAYSKSVWTTLPTCVRVENQYLQDICVAAGASNYTYLDFGWAQWRWEWGPPQTYYQNHVNDGRSVQLGAMSGINLLCGGSGRTAPWNQHPADSKPNLFGMSPQEIDACGAAFSALTTMIGIDVWSQNPNFDDIGYYTQTSIQTALTAYANRAIGRLMGPVNWRGGTGGSGSTDTGPSTGTVGGSWSVVGTGEVRRSEAASGTISVPGLDNVTSGQLVGLLCYSRDSARSATLPSGWSEAARVSGNSAQGGDLALFYRIASGAVGSTNVAFPGTSVSNSVMGKMFAFSGNTTMQGAVLSTVGSDSSWPRGSSNMGPVKGGFTSAHSDALVLICAAKTNDFANGDPPPEDTMSATTSGGESWNRLFIETNGLGDDSGMFVDYAFLSGTPSIATKSWTQGDGAGSNSSGAGCGFMVSFRPAAVVAGVPPTIAEFEDITLSLGSTLDFTLTSAGSTPITWSLTSGPSNVTLNSGTGAYQWTPLAAGTYFQTVKATNSHGSHEDGWVTVVAPIDTSGPGTGNVPPIVTHPGDKTVVAQNQLSFVIQSIDSDGDALTYNLEDPPDGALIVQDTGHFVWTPTGTQGPGTYGMVVLVSDGQHESRSTFTVTVQDTPWTKSPETPINQFRRI